MPKRLSFVTILFLALAISAQASIVAGHDYVVLDTPQRPDSSGKIDVVEFFSWGCPHCFEFYPMLSRWMATLPKDVRFKRIPVDLGHPEWEALAKTYYALQATGDVDRLDAQIFEDIHRNHVRLYDEPSITAWVGKHGVNVAKFTEAYRSFGVMTAAGQGEQNAETWRIPGVPALAIGGKYLVSGNQERMLSTSDQLIPMARVATKLLGK